MPRDEQRPVEVLLIDDDPADVRLLRETLNELTHGCILSVARSGEEALDRLFRHGSYSLESTPDLILLDLNLPVLSGHEVLAALKAMPPLNTIPVIVLTTSQAPADIRRAYELGASCYVIKPCDLHSFANVCRSLSELWFRHVSFARQRLPARSFSAGD